MDMAKVNANTFVQFFMFIVLTLLETKHELVPAVEPVSLVEESFETSFDCMMPFNRDR
jgi:hypothetical protein